MRPADRGASGEPGPVSMTPPTHGNRLARLKRVSMILFVALSILTLAGPALIYWVGRGGERPTYPPDRPLEWKVFLGVIGLYIVLFALTLYVSALVLRQQKRERK